MASPGVDEQLLAYRRNADYRVASSITPVELATMQTVFSEFSDDPHAVIAHTNAFRLPPWTLHVDGLVKHRQRFGLEQLVTRFGLEERVYRFRCVEPWSMVVPWIGFSLRRLLNFVQPMSTARFVEFTAMHDPEQMPNQRVDAAAVLKWPYVEALRLDEALHPLTLLAVGMYGMRLPVQNGASLRLVVPWKYGYKSCKSVVRIRLTQHQPATSWPSALPNEYDFIANVDPAAAHPRWSQARERVLGTNRWQATLPYNGYHRDVGALYSDM